MSDPYVSTLAFFRELVGQGVTDVLVSPGSRSTPLAISAHRTDGLDVSIHLDERSSAFWALGMAKASGRPVALVCTSGTAAANYLPAIVEAHFSEVPLIVLTADRPPELRDRGAGQTIDQLAIYGSHVRWWSDLPVAGDVEPAWFRSTAARAVRVATGPRPGPVHLNWPLREPLEPLPGATPPEPVPPIRLSAEPTAPTPAAIHLLDELSRSERGLVLAGPLHDEHHVDAVLGFCRRTGWPLLAEPLSQLRRSAEGVAVISHHDHLLRTEWADRHRPEVVLRVGQPMTCKPLRLWLERHRPRHVLLDPGDSWTDASTTVTDIITAGPAALGRSGQHRGTTSWTDSWAEADRGAIDAVDRLLDAEPLMEAAIARELGRSLPPDSVLYVSNSMPVRDIDTFLRRRNERLMCFGNRGASGIDGVVSSAAGVASTGRATTLYIGDLALMHDISGLLSAIRHEVDMTIVVANNDGGGIFSFLPIAGADGVDFETLFRTPQSHSIAALVEAAGASHSTVRSVDDLALELSLPAAGLRILEVAVDRDANVDQHRRITTAVAERVSPK